MLNIVIRLKKDLENHYNPSWIIIKRFIVVITDVLCIFSDEAFESGGELWRGGEPAFGWGLSTHFTLGVKQHLCCRHDIGELPGSNPSYLQEVGGFCGPDSAQVCVCVFVLMPNIFCQFREHLYWLFWVLSNTEKLLFNLCIKSRVGYLDSNCNCELSWTWTNSGGLRLRYFGRKNFSEYRWFHLMCTT